jgi:hypothetical protein
MIKNQKLAGVWGYIPLTITQNASEGLTMKVRYNQTETKFYSMIKHVPVKIASTDSNVRYRDGKEAERKMRQPKVAW